MNIPQNIKLDELVEYFPKHTLTISERDKLWHWTREAVAKHPDSLAVKDDDPGEFYIYCDDTTDALAREGARAQLVYLWQQGYWVPVIGFLKNVQPSHHHLMKLENLLSRETAS